jgi:hypothetical protein
MKCLTEIGVRLHDVYQGIEKLTKGEGGDTIRGRIETLKAYLNSAPLVRKRTLPTERPPLVDEI